MLIFGGVSSAYARDAHGSATVSRIPRETQAIQPHSPSGRWSRYSKIPEIKPKSILTGVEFDYTDFVMSKVRISETDELMAEFCHATSSPRRSVLIRILGHGERAVSELAAETGFSATNVSQHLKVLRDKRIVGVRRSGGRATYRLLQPKILQAMQIMREAFAESLSGGRLGLTSEENGQDGLDSGTSTHE